MCDKYVAAAAARTLVRVCVCVLGSRCECDEKTRLRELPVLHSCDSNLVREKI